MKTRFLLTILALSWLTANVSAQTTVKYSDLPQVTVPAAEDGFGYYWWTGSNFLSRGMLWSSVLTAINSQIDAKVLVQGTASSNYTVELTGVKLSTNGAGSGLTALNAAAVTLGTLPDARLSSKITNSVFGSSIVAFGDSIGVGYYSDYPATTTYTNSYLNQVANNLNLPLVNNSVSGRCVVDQMSTVFTHVTSYTNIYIYALGANDQRLAPATFPTYEWLVRGQLGWLTSDRSELYTASHTNVSFYGTWNNDAQAFMPGKYTATTGDGVVISNVYGTSFVIGFLGWRQFSSSGVMDVYVDGVKITSQNVILPIAYISNTGVNFNYVECASVYTGFTNTTHTISLTNSGGAYITFEYLAAPDMMIKKPKVFVMEVTRQQPTYSSGGSDAELSAFNSALRRTVNLFSDIGFDVTYVPVAGVLTPDQMVDALHPNGVGHTNMANALLGSMRGSFQAPKQKTPVFRNTIGQAFRLVVNETTNGFVFVPQ